MKNNRWEFLVKKDTIERIFKFFTWLVVTSVIGNFSVQPKVGIFLNIIGFCVYVLLQTLLFMHAVYIINDYESFVWGGSKETIWGKIKFIAFLIIFVVFSIKVLHFKSFG